MDARIVESVRAKGLAPCLKDVLIACFDQIIARRISSLADLFEYLSDFEWDLRLERIVQKCASLIREVHWGVFRGLDRDRHPELWKALTVSNRLVPDVADLKRNIVVPSIYCGLVDIHAYTDFCEQHRHNASMLRTLDDLIQKDMRQLADRNGCISCRSSGDTIIVIGTSAAALIRTCLGITDCFSRKRVLRDETLAVRRQGNTVILQDMHVSAGIAGGRQYSSLIVTDDGDVSGSAINTASRLQSFAAATSPDQSKIMVTSHVYSRYTRETERAALKNGDTFGFFGCGKIGFKGIDISVYEILYTDRDNRKIAYQKQYDELLATVGKRVWKDRLIPDVLKLVITVLETTPIAKTELIHDGRREVHTTRSVIALCDEAIERYSHDHNHRDIGQRLRHIDSILDAAAGFDTLVLFYFREIVTLYDRMAREFESREYERILSNQLGLFSKDERKLMNDVAQLEKLRDKLIERGKQNNNIYSPTVLWSQVVSEYEKTWEFEFYSGKR